MKRLLKSKKGFKTAVTFLAILFIFATFLIFTAPFRMDLKKTEGQVQSGFGSVETEFFLKSLLMSPSTVEPKKLKLSVNEVATLAEVLSTTCKNHPDGNYPRFKTDAEKYLGGWLGLDKNKKLNYHLRVIYYTPDGDPGFSRDEIKSEKIGADFDFFTSDFIKSRAFNMELKRTGHQNLATNQEFILFQMNLRQDNMAMQVLPCKDDGTLIKVILVVLGK